MSAFQDVVIHKDIVTEQISGITHVLKKTTNTGRKMKNMSGAILFKDDLCFSKRSKMTLKLSGENSLYLKSPSLELRKTHSSS